MNTTAFDELTLAMNDAQPRRRLVQRFMALALGGLLAHAGIGFGAAKKKCGDCQRRKKNGQCKPRRDGSRCGNSRSCQDGKCRPCEGEGTPCQEDIQCCSGICDRYVNACTKTRFDCNPNKKGQCTDGICCPDAVSPSGGICVNSLVNKDACGTDCNDLDNCFDITGETACRKGKCCCLESTCTRPNGDPVPRCKS